MIGGQRRDDRTGWTVRDIVAHLAGAAAATASVREQLRQQRIGAKQKGERFQIDAVNDLQIRERSELSNVQLRDQLTELTAASGHIADAARAWMTATVNPGTTLTGTWNRAVTQTAS